MHGVEGSPEEWLAQLALRDVIARMARDLWSHFGPRNGARATTRATGLYSLLATCQANGANPEAYLADVLLRVQTQPAAQIDDLLPDRWMRPAPDTS